MEQASWVQVGMGCKLKLQRSTPIFFFFFFFKKKKKKKKRSTLMPHTFTAGPTFWTLQSRVVAKLCDPFRIRLITSENLRGFLVAAPKERNILQTTAATNDSELLSALTSCMLMETKEMNLPKHWKRESSDRLYRDSVLLVGVQKLLLSLLFLLNMAMWF